MQIDTLKHFWTILLGSRVATKFLSVAIMSLAIFRAWLAYQTKPSVALMILGVSELLTLILLVFSRPPRDLDASLLKIVCALGGSFFLLFVDLDIGATLVVPWLSEGVQIVGLVLSLIAKLYMGFAFGLVPANRGIVSSGPYRFVRHPIYLGYLMMHIGFLSVNFTMMNLVILVLVYSLQIARILFEERLLARDPGYVDYQRRVRWRLVPFVF